MYDIAAARAERAAGLTPITPFQFELDGSLWEMRNPADLPATWHGWQWPSGFVRNVDTVFFEVVDEAADDAEARKPLLFPLASLTSGEFDALLSAGLQHYMSGASVGEAAPPAS